VQDLFAEEEDLLNMHMSVIQENAELLTEEVFYFYQDPTDHSLASHHYCPRVIAFMLLLINYFFYLLLLITRL